MHRPTPTEDMLKKKEQKDAELDRKIEALRKKNEVLMKRYQEVEEDKKMAEEEGMALQSRKVKAEDLTITINKSSSESRLVMKKPGTGSSPNSKGVHSQGDDSASPSVKGRGKRRQLLVTMASNTKGKRVVSEKIEGGPVGVQDPSGDQEELTVRGRQPCMTKKEGGSQESEMKQDVRQGLMEKIHRLSECDSSHQDAEGPGHTDLALPTSRQEQLEYLRWKREREEIDRERVARHRNDQGQWKRAWDVDKTDAMFAAKARGGWERDTQTRKANQTADDGRRESGRITRKGQRKSPTEARGPNVRSREKVPVVSSKATGKDRLTGRARKWDANDEDNNVQPSETSLEEFLEELDALVQPEVKVVVPEAHPQALKTPGPLDPDQTLAAPTNPPADPPGDESSRAVDPVMSLPRVTEKKVRFVDDVAEGPGEGGSSETKGLGNSKLPPRKIDVRVEGLMQTSERQREGAPSPRDQRVPRRAPVQIQANSPSEGLEKILKPPEASKPDGVCEQKPALCPQAPVERGDSAAHQEKASLAPEHTKSRSTGELIDSSLSVPSLNSGDGHPEHTTCTDKAKQNGKIV